MERRDNRCTLIAVAVARQLAGLLGHRPDRTHYPPGALAWRAAAIRPLREGIRVSAPMPLRCTNSAMSGARVGPFGVPRVVASCRRCCLAPTRCSMNAGSAFLGVTCETLVMMGSGVRVPPSASLHRRPFAGQASRPAIDFAADSVHRAAFRLTCRPDRLLRARALGGVIALEDARVVEVTDVDSVARLTGHLDYRAALPYEQRRRTTRADRTAAGRRTAPACFRARDVPPEADTYRYGLAPAIRTPSARSRSHALAVSRRR